MDIAPVKSTSVLLIRPSVFHTDVLPEKQDVNKTPHYIIIFNNSFENVLNINTFYTFKTQMKRICNKSNLFYTKSIHDNSLLGNWSKLTHFGKSQQPSRNTVL